MVSLTDQEELFRLVARNLQQDLTCWAFGGTAMIYYGQKDETKDIDLLFKDEQDRDLFIDALERLGFAESSPVNIYVPEKLRDKTKPLMFTRGEMRIDLFAEKVFRTTLSPAMREGEQAVHEYRDKKTLKIRMVSNEHLVYLKGITDRTNDLIDIKTIIAKRKRFDWALLVDEAVWQHAHGDSWALLDTERTLKALKQDNFIEERLFKKLYDAQAKKPQGAGSEKESRSKDSAQNIKK